MHFTAAPPFRVKDLYDVAHPGLVLNGLLGRELDAVEEASALGPVSARFLSGLSEPVLREFLRRSFLRVRNAGELTRLRARYAELAAYFPPRSVTGCRSDGAAAQAAPGTPGACGRG